MQVETLNSCLNEVVYFSCNSAITIHFLEIRFFKTIGVSKEVVPRLSSSRTSSTANEYLHKEQSLSGEEDYTRKLHLV